MNRRAFLMGAVGIGAGTAITAPFVASALGYVGTNIETVDKPVTVRLTETEVFRRATVQPLTDRTDGCIPLDYAMGHAESWQYPPETVTVPRFPDVTIWLDGPRWSGRSLTAELDIETVQPVNAGPAFTYHGETIVGVGMALPEAEVTDEYNASVCMPPGSFELNAVTDNGRIAAKTTIEVTEK